MNMIDILLAKSMSAGGSGSGSGSGVDDETRQTAAQALQTANEAKNSIENLTYTAAIARTAAEEARSAAEIASNKAIETKEDLADFKNSFDLQTSENDEAAEIRLKIKNNRATIKNYKKAGTNTDGSMTQKAITEAIRGEEEPEQETAHTVGLEIDYDSRSFTRLGQEDFPIYQQINRCLVDDNGEIIAFYGDDIYLDDYISGYQTMVYIPKFYYKRDVILLEDKVIKKEQIYISDKPQTGFKLHPAFINANGEEVDYILYSAYEGSTFDVSANGYNRTDTTVAFDEDKLASIAQAKPLSGANNELTLATAEQLAQNRGDNWHVTSIKAESAIQMLAIIDFGMLNGQTALEEGISRIENITGINCASYTGSTANLGNATGAAEQTINEKNGIETTYSEPGYRAISYHGIENPWGNIWRLVQGIKIIGSGNSTKGGVPYICSGLNFSTDEYVVLDFTLPNSSDWISNFGYNADYDYLFIPVAAASANSILPVGDYVWIKTNLSGTNLAVLGGNWSFKESNGLFYYGFDRAITYSGKNYGARLMFIPPKDEVYERNLLAFKASIGG